MSSPSPPIFDMSERNVLQMRKIHVHIGSRNCTTMLRYIWRRRADGTYVINVEKTWQKLVFAARIVAVIKAPCDVCVVLSRIYGHQAVRAYAAHTGARTIMGRFVPGTFTNCSSGSFQEPLLLIVVDPVADRQAMHEASQAEIPVVAFCDTDAILEFVDVVIPCNNRSAPAIGLMWWLLVREVLRLRGEIPRTNDGWNVSVHILLS
ncbi:hypothetical protein CERSUDRAFT_160619 [Gelatoporia subvermispora B]|uniref:Small ribosomal subunit protein uS2 n=1 Tax=Ceriporiopsis subvermispora (strain B) TaxID=914234 RepID=M2PBV7_CERS8|nr:hypothetical protein CERSUDRAFT_160619 [Gelatoporia subvermispora B]